MVQLTLPDINFRSLSALGFDKPTIRTLQTTVEVARSIQDGDIPNQTAEEIKTAYESNSDTNAFTDALKTKLEGVESGATADQTGAEIKTAYEAESNTNAYTDAEKTKLSGIESGATADQTDAEILAAWESESGLDDANLFLLDGTRAMTDALQLHSTDVAGAPTAGTAGRVIYVTDGDAGSPCLAVDNGTDWLRVSLGAAISTT